MRVSTKSILEITRKYQTNASFSAHGCVLSEIDILVDSLVGES